MKLEQVIFAEKPSCISCKQRMIYAEGKKGNAGWGNGSSNKGWVCPNGCYSTIPLVQSGWLSDKGGEHD